MSEITGTRTSCREKRRKPVQDQLPANNQGETPASHQSGGPTCLRKSFKCSSQVSSREAWHSNPNSRWDEGTYASGHQPEWGGGGD